MVDKLTRCEMVLLNRAPVGADKMELHKVLRGVSRRTDIGYDYVDGSFDYDEIEDPLPFDINAPVIEIGDNDFAVWYRDLTEEMEKYQGKTVRLFFWSNHLPFRACKALFPRRKHRNRNQTAIRR